MPASDHIDSFTRALRHLGALYMRLAARQSAVRGEATKQELLALGVLGQSGPLRMSDLAERLGIGQSAVTPVVDRLEARGLARRTRSQADRRVWLVELTPEGEEVFAEEDAVYREVAAAMLAPLDPAERATLAALMDKITALGEIAVPED